MEVICLATDASTRFQPSNETLHLIASIDEFKGEWRVVERIQPERLT
jgi:hypothetical protein